MTEYWAYLAGPMSGIPKFNIPAFEGATAHLREQGWNLISPAELDSPKMRAQALQSADGDLAKLEHGTGETWGEVLARDVKIVADRVQAIVLLPGWSNSRGAVLEATVGLLCKHDFYLYDQMDGACRVPSSLIKELLNGSPKL
jgi:Domain of unknown function (DUF4406)